MLVIFPTQSPGGKGLIALLRLPRLLKPEIALTFAKAAGQSARHDRGVPPQGLRQIFLDPNPPNLMRVMPPKGVRSEAISVSAANSAPTLNLKLVTPT
jgi:hypothetical protein